MADRIGEGDQRVVSDYPGMGHMTASPPIDAHSVRAGTFTEERKVNGQTVFLTEDGARAYDDLAQKGHTMSVEGDPGWLKRWLLGDREEYRGSLQAPDHSGSK